MFLKNTLLDLFEDVPLAIRRNIWFQIDGASPHFAQIVRNLVNESFFEPLDWQGTECAYSLATSIWGAFWGAMKVFVYMVPIENETHLGEIILQGTNKFSLKPKFFRMFGFR